MSLLTIWRSIHLILRRKESDEVTAHSPAGLSPFVERFPSSHWLNDIVQCYRPTLRKCVRFRRRWTERSVCPRSGGTEHDRIRSMSRRGDIRGERHPGIRRYRRERETPTLWNELSACPTCSTMSASETVVISSMLTVAAGSPTCGRAHPATRFRCRLWRPRSKYSRRQAPTRVNSSFLAELTAAGARRSA